jgi:hypothetical protein
MLDASTVMLVVGCTGAAVTITGYVMNRPVQKAQVRASASQELANLNDALNRTNENLKEQITDLYRQVATLSQQLAASNKECDERLNREIERQRKWFTEEIARVRQEHRADRRESAPE